MVYYFSLRGNYPLIETLTQSELSTIEQISLSNGIHVGIELIENGAIIYMDATFSEENFLKFKKIYLEKTQIYDKDHLPVKYMEWYDSVTQETLYYTTSVDQYLQHLLSIIREFIGPERGAALMGEIYTRIVQKSNACQNGKNDIKKLLRKKKRRE